MSNKVVFDGVQKLITVQAGETSLNIRSDVYTSWIDWVATGDNSKYLPSIRVTGLDPIGGGVYTGDVYFLINGWKLVVDFTVTKVSGVLYSDDYDTAYYTPSLAPQYPATVSALVNTVSTGGGSGGASAVEIRQEMDSHSVKMAQIQSLLDIMDTKTANAVWSTSISSLEDATTIGGWMRKKVLTVAKFIGLQ